MIDGIRSNIGKENYYNVRKSVKFPPSATFNDSLTELLKQFKELKKQ